uniref:Integral membrane bound transporter domain-containing protein n=1 Tax=Mucochytrium quahogii TaxID=96639 RepID=A0A7S2S6D3_9STRA|mmetsp:Transcript_34686/g.55500  ORF Transcript_34686/g.55500 Transcript_34686/m.55500 type:complete len:1264 (+) Transcript_34686:458-4249(+)
MMDDGVELKQQPRGDSGNLGNEVEQALPPFGVQLVVDGSDISVDDTETNVGEDTPKGSSLRDLVEKFWCISRAGQTFFEVLTRDGELREVRSKHAGKTSFESMKLICSNAKFGSLSANGLVRCIVKAQSRVWFGRESSFRFALPAGYGRVIDIGLSRSGDLLGVLYCNYIVLLECDFGKTVKVADLEEEFESGQGRIEVENANLYVALNRRTGNVWITKPGSITRGLSTHDSPRELCLDESGHILVLEQNRRVVLLELGNGREVGRWVPKADERGYVHHLARNATSGQVFVWSPGQGAFLIPGSFETKAFVRVLQVCPSDPSQIVEPCVDGKRCLDTWTPVLSTNGAVFDLSVRDFEKELGYVHVPSHKFGIFWYEIANVSLQLVVKGPSQGLFSKQYFFTRPDFGWRVEYALRLALGVFVCCIVMFTVDSRRFFEFNGYSIAGPAFAGFVTVIISDVTYGKTIMNAWAAILVAFPVTLILSGVLASQTRESYGPHVALPVLAVLVFVLQYLDLPAAGKKLALSLVCFNLITQLEAVDPWKAPLYLYANVLMGIVFAFVGVLFPWPRMAILELHGRGRYTIWALNKVLIGLFDGLRGNLVARNALVGQHRLELLDFVRGNLSICRARLLESRFGPERGRAIKWETQLLALLDKLLLSEHIICKTFMKIDFEDSDAYRRLITLLDKPLLNLQIAMVNALSLLAISDRERARGIKCAAASLLAAAKTFEVAYFDVRTQVIFEDGDELSSESVLRYCAILHEIDLSVQRIHEFIVSEGEYRTSRRWRKGEFVNLFWELVPKQPHFKELFACRWTMSLRLRVVSAFKITLAITLAGIVGFYGYSPPDGLVAFTIAYIGTDRNQGSNIHTSLMRGLGTVVATVYVTVVLALIKALDVYVQQAVVATIAAIVFVIPAIYIRSIPHISYSGTVAAFTCVLLLVGFPQEDADQVTLQRTTDTFIGVFILVAVELIVFPLRSEIQLTTVLVSSLNDGVHDLKVFLEWFINRANHVEYTAPQCKMVDLTALMGKATQLHGLAGSMSVEPRFWRITTSSIHMREIVEAQLFTFTYILHLAQTINLEEKRWLSIFQYEGDTEHTKELMMGPLAAELEIVRTHIVPIGQRLIFGINGLSKSVPSLALRQGSNIHSWGILFPQEHEAIEQDSRYQCLSEADIDILADSVLKTYTWAVGLLQSKNKVDPQRRISSNREIKLVCAIVNSLLEVFVGLKRLRSAVTHAQSTRILAATQHPYRSKPFYSGEGESTQRYYKL